MHIVLMKIGYREAVCALQFMFSLNSQRMFFLFISFKKAQPGNECSNLYPKGIKIMISLRLCLHYSLVSTRKEGEKGGLAWREGCWFGSRVVFVDSTPIMQSQLHSSHFLSLI